LENFCKKSSSHKAAGNRQSIFLANATQSGTQCARPHEL
jgi:hypothetical protein